MSFRTEMKVNKQQKYFYNYFKLVFQDDRWSSSIYLPYMSVSNNGNVKSIENKHLFSKQTFIERFNIWTHQCWTQRTHKKHLFLCGNIDVLLDIGGLAAGGVGGLAAGGVGGLAAVVVGRRWRSLTK